MLLLDRTLDAPAENLALDEALLESAEAGAGASEVLRLWESPQYLAVLGSSSRAEEEVDQGACGRRGVAVVRRSSGGSSVVVGPGCLMYSLVLSYEGRSQLRMIEAAHRFILGEVRAAISGLVPGVVMSGTSDLTQAGRKFSGNSLRCKRHHFLYHGTLLCGFPLPLIADCLRMPPRQPAYRAGRSHGEFLTNLPASADQLRAALARHFGAERPLTDWPSAKTFELAAQKYSDRAWIFRR